jgi:hypothetical protein
MTVAAIGAGAAGRASQLTRVEYASLALAKRAAGSRATARANQASKGCSASSTMPNWRARTEAGTSGSNRISRMIAGSVASS